MTISGVAPHANIIAYAGCCTLSALTASIDQAIIDGVDVINYSIGSPSASDVWNDFDTVGFLDAREAGIFVATSAGNEGPGPETVGSPADAPWLTSVGASTHDRPLDQRSRRHDRWRHRRPADITGKGFTVGYGPAPIVYAGDFGDALCQTPFPAGTWTNGEIVVCDRGDHARVDKGAMRSRPAAPAASSWPTTPPTATRSSGMRTSFPAVHISYDDGEVLKAWLASGTRPHGHHHGRIGVCIDDPVSATSSPAFSRRAAPTARSTSSRRT